MNETDTILSSIVANPRGDSLAGPACRYLGGVMQRGSKFPIVFPEGTAVNSPLAKLEIPDNEVKAPTIAINATKSKHLVFTKMIKEQQKVVLPPPALLESFDAESVKGRFGWYTLGTNNHIPYLMRNGEKYFPVRMIQRYLDPYLIIISDDIYLACTNIATFYVTEAERALLTNINSFHCNFAFGQTEFSKNDLLIRLDDGMEFYKFLVVCNSKLNRQNTSNKCGFLLLNKKQYVPYITYNKQRYVPLFYFERTDLVNLTSTIPLKGWNLAYLKFCLKVQNVRNELVQKEEILVCNFEEIRTYLESTVIDDVWLDPSSVKIPSKLPGPKGFKLWYNLPNESPPLQMLK